MDATVAERGQITLPKAVRDALGLVKGTRLKVELIEGRIVLRKDVGDALSRVRGRFKLAEGFTSTDDAMRAALDAEIDDTSQAVPVDGLVFVNRRERNREDAAEGCGHGWWFSLCVSGSRVTR